MKHLPVVLVLLLFACYPDSLPPVLPTSPLPPSPPPPPPSPGPSVSVVSGDLQTGTYGQFLAESLVVRVTNAAGEGASGVPVWWRTQSGWGEFQPQTWYTYTGVGGLASVRFRPMWPSPATVTASVVGYEQVATFIVSASGPPVVLMQLVPFFDCGDFVGSFFRGPSDSIPLGATVEWDLWCGGQLRSISVPPGGTPFDSGLIWNQHFIAPLDVPGDWIVQDLFDGTKVTLRVRP